MATMNVSLPDLMKEWVEEQIKTGHYSNASDYVRDLIRRDQEYHDRRETLVKALIAKTVACLTTGSMTSGKASRPGTVSMYKLSEAAASDIEAILTRSALDFGVERTETYFQSLTHCLELLGDNPEMGRQIVRPWIEAGATWWNETRWEVPRTPQGQAIALERIRQGPPR